MLNALSARWQEPGKQQQFLLAAIGTALVLLAALAAMASVGGTKLGLVLAVALVVSPLGLYFFFTRPIIFPFGLFVLLLPFDNVMAVSSYGTITKLLGGLSALAVALHALRTRQFISPPRAAVIWLALLVWAAATIYWAIDPNMAASKYPTYAMVIGLYFILASVKVSASDFGSILKAVLLGGVLAAAYGAYYYHLNPPSDLMGTGQRLMIQVGDDFIDPNHFANALALPTAIAIGLALRTSRSMKKALYFGCVGLLLAAYFFASSRGAFLGLGAIFIYFFIRSRHRAQMFAIVGIALAAGLLLNTSIWDRFGTAFTSQGAGRFPLWSVGFAAFKHHWLVGAGIGNFESAYDAQYLNIFQAYAAKWARPAHNLLLQSGVEFGLVGLVLVLWGWGSQLLMLRPIGPAHRLYDLRIALEAACIGLFVGAMSVDMLWYKYLWEAFIMMALLRSVALYDVPRNAQPAVRARA